MDDSVRVVPGVVTVILGLAIVVAIAVAGGVRDRRRERDLGVWRSGIGRRVVVEMVSRRVKAAIVVAEGAGEARMLFVLPGAVGPAGAGRC